MNGVDEGGKPSRYFKVLVKPYLENGEAECSYSKKGYTFKNIHNNIQQLTNLEVDGIDGAKSHLTCYNEKISNSPKFFYLGQFKGYYYAQKKFRFLNPHVWLRKIGTTYSINVLAGLFPCPNLNILHEPNVWLYPCLLYTSPSPRDRG